MSIDQSKLDRIKATTEGTERRVVKSVYHDGDGSVYPYDQHGEVFEEWPSGWPDRIADVRTFCRCREIAYIR